MAMQVGFVGGSEGPAVHGHRIGFGEHIVPA
jgi:hypothetical protein